MYRRIIWANDGSPAMAAVLPVVRRVAETTGAEIIVAHVHAEMAADRMEGIGRREQRLDLDLQRTVNDLNRDGFDARLALTEGNGERTGEVISNLAQESGADLIITGTRNRGLLTRILLGSFSVDLIRTVPCPVLVIPDRIHDAEVPRPSVFDQRAG